MVWDVVAEMREVEGHGGGMMGMIGERDMFSGAKRASGTGRAHNQWIDGWVRAAVEKAIIKRDIFVKEMYIYIYIPLGISRKKNSKRGLWMDAF